MKVTTTKPNQEEGYDVETCEQEESGADETEGYDDETYTQDTQLSL